LVVPHEIENPDDITPLGLVSIRIVPRFAPGTVRVSYSFSWRTVEALVGFPYSLYGSVRYAQWLTGEIARGVGEKLPGRKVEVGSVSYIAHSLHFFVDENADLIARRIVDDASD
jgi:hypothetical protein